MFVKMSQNRYFYCKNKSHETNGTEDYELTANTLSVSPAMSAFGREIELSDGNFVKFLNTSAIDTWIVILKAVMKNNPPCLFPTRST